MPSRPKEPISGTSSLGKIAFSHHSRMLGFILSRTNPRTSSRVASSSSESRESMFNRSSGSGDSVSEVPELGCIVVILPPLLDSGAPYGQHAGTLHEGIDGQRNQIVGPEKTQGRAPLA